MPRSVGTVVLLLDRQIGSGWCLSEGWLVGGSLWLGGLVSLEGHVVVSQRGDSSTGGEG